MAELGGVPGGGISNLINVVVRRNKTITSACARVFRVKAVEVDWKNLVGEDMIA